MKDGRLAARLDYRLVVGVPSSEVSDKDDDLEITAFLQTSPKYKDHFLNISDSLIYPQISSKYDNTGGVMCDGGVVKVMEVNIGAMAEIW